MTQQSVSVPAREKPPSRDPVTLFVRWIVLALAVVGGLGVIVMMVVTCADVVLRAFGRPITGAFDIVRSAAVLGIAGALPYTTAVRGHVSIDFLYQKFGSLGRLVIRILVAVLTVPLLVLLTWECFSLGTDYRLHGEVTPTLQMPIFWMPWVIAASCAVTAIVLVHELFFRREVVKP